MSVRDADGAAYHYRFVCSRLERRTNFSSIWTKVCAGDFERMTPAELRYVADVMEGKTNDG